MVSCSGLINTGIYLKLNKLKAKKKPSFQFSTTSPSQKTNLMLFDSQIKPTMLYACEAWADSLKGDVEGLQLLSTNKLEKLQTSIFKQLLGVSRKTTNLAIVLELGRYLIAR